MVGRGNRVLGHFLLTFSYYVLRGGYQRRALLYYQNEEKIILNISYTRVGIEPIDRRVYSHKLVPLRHDA